MKHTLLSICLSLCGLLSATDSFAAHPIRVMVVIGYADTHDSFAEKLGVGSYKFLPALATATAQDLQEVLSIANLQKETPMGPNSAIQKWSSADGFKQVTLLNANYNCTGESANANQVTRRYQSECLEQKNTSSKISAYIKANLMKYDVMIYIGHARYGSGLGIGNFNDDKNKIDLHAFSRGYQNPNNKLKLVMISSCDSLRHYQNALGSKVKFLGYLNAAPDWYGELLPGTMEILNRILTEPDFIARSPQKAAIDSTL